MPVHYKISVYIHSWFFKKISRKEAEKLLLAEENARGTFLVRCSEHNPQGYSLSVKDWEETRGHHVKHYKIKPLDNGGYYIATNQTFSTLQALVLAYTSECWKQLVFVSSILFNSLSSNNIHFGHLSVMCIRCYLEHVGFKLFLCLVLHLSER